MCELIGEWRLFTSGFKTWMKYLRREILLPVWYFMQYTVQYNPCLKAAPSAPSVLVQKLELHSMPRSRDSP